jgi:hypothetical protein
MNIQTEALPVTERGDNLFAHVGMIDHDFVKTRRRQALQVPHDQRLATDLEQGLRARVGQWPHAFAPARRQQHGLQNV